MSTRLSRCARDAASAALVAAAADAADEDDASDDAPDDDDADYAMPSPPRSSQPQQQPDVAAAAPSPGVAAAAATGRAPAAAAAAAASSSTRNVQIHIANRNIAAKEKAVWIAPSGNCDQLKDFAALVAAAVGPRWSDAALGIEGDETLTESSFPKLFNDQSTKFTITFNVGSGGCSSCHGMAGTSHNRNQCPWVTNKQHVKTEKKEIGPAFQAVEKLTELRRLYPDRPSGDYYMALNLIKDAKAGEDGDAKAREYLEKSHSPTKRRASAAAAGAIDTGTLSAFAADFAARWIAGQSRATLHAPAQLSPQPAASGASAANSVASPSYRPLNEVFPDLHSLLCCPSVDAPHLLPALSALHFKPADFFHLTDTELGAAPYTIPLHIVRRIRSALHGLRAA